MENLDINHTIRILSCWNDNEDGEGRVKHCSGWIGIQPNLAQFEYNILKSIFDHLIIQISRV